MTSRVVNWLLAGAVTVVALAGWEASAAAAPQPVTIVRDSHGEPHITGSSAAAATYGFAYAQMEDQADAVLENLAEAMGRSAELTGPACLPACFKADQTTHLFRIPEVASEKFDTIPAADRQRFRAFAQGINDYVGQHPDGVPAWARNVTFTAPDVVASVEWRFVMAQLNRARAGGALNFPTTVADAGLRAAAAETEGSGPARFIDLFDDPQYRIEMNASNMFAVDGTKTASGKPILNSDPHLQFEGDTQWYQAQVSYPGVSVEGSTFRGIPAIGIGANGHVAWGHTSNQGTIHEQDAYKEVLEPGNPDSYLYGAGYRPMTIRTVQIKAQTSPGTVVSVPVRFRYTIHGPVVTDPIATVGGSQPNPGTTYAGSVTASQYEQVGLASEFWAEERAADVDEFKQAMSNVQLSQFNTMVADEDGNIYFVATSRSGRLAGDGSPGNAVDFAHQPLDGSDPFNTWVSDDPDRPWTGVLGLDELPQAENPPSGFYQNANNTPWTTAPGQISQGDVPYYMRGGNDGTRSRRQRELLTAASDLTLDDVDEIAKDDKVEFAGALEDLLAVAAADPAADPRVVAGYDLLDAWDDHADQDSTAMPLFTAWVRGLDKAKLGNSGPSQGPVNPQQASAPYPTGIVGQPGGYTPTQIQEAARAMIAAVDAMQATYGSIEKLYGEVHTMDWGSFSGPLNGGTDDSPTLFLTACKTSFPAAQLIAYPCSASNGSGYVLDFDLGSGEMHTMKPASASDDPDSPFYAKNAEDFSAGQFRDFPTLPADVEAAATSVEHLALDDPAASIAAVFTGMPSPPVACVVKADPYQGQRWCGGTSSRVASFDGTPIDVNVAFPPASAGVDGNYSLIGIFHGWGGAKAGFAGEPQRWLSRGYAVMSMSDRGWAETCGFPTSRQSLPAWANCDKGYIQLIDQRTDVRDAQYLLGRLVGEGLVDPQRIGAIGGSYGGGMSSSLALLKDRVVMPDGHMVPWRASDGTPISLAAAMPGNFWVDLANSLLPNGHQLDYVADSPYFGPVGGLPVGVEKAAVVNGLYGTTTKPPANPRGYVAPPGTAPNADLANWLDLWNGPGPYDRPDMRSVIQELLDHHSPYYIDDSEPPAPIFMKNGWNDDLFPADETIHLFNKLRTEFPDNPIGMALADIGHARAQGKAEDVDAIDGLMDAWADYYVKGVGAKPPGGVYVTSFTCPSTALSDGPHHYDSWADVAPGEVRLEGGAAQTLAPTGSQHGADFQRTSPCTKVDATDNPSSANYRTPAATGGGYTVLGSATIKADIETGGPSDQLAARLVDVAPDGTEILIERGLLRPFTGEGAKSNLFQLHPNFWHVADGHLLKLELLADDAPYSHVNVTSPDAAAQHPVTVSNLELRIPVKEEPGAGGGMVLEPLPKVLPAGYRLASDFKVTPVEPPGGKTRSAKTVIKRIGRRVGARGRVSLRLGCSTIGMERCRGRVWITTKRRALGGKARGRRSRQPATIGSRTYSIGHGRHWVKVRLGKRARRALRRHRLRVTIHWTTRQASGPSRRKHRVVTLRRS